MRIALLLLAALAAPAHAGWLASAGKVDITPELGEHSIWIAGYGATGQRPRAVHDPLYARALVVSDGTTTVALVGADLLGLFRRQNRRVAEAAGFTGERDFLMLGATHTHAGPDTVGLWGRFPGVSGVDPRYLGSVERKIARLLKDLRANLKPAKLSAGKVELDPNGLWTDLRDPRVIDPDVAVLHAVSAEGEPLGTVVNWSCHPEALDKHNRELSADVAGALCRTVEEGLGGTCVFLNGSIGGMMSPDVPDGLDRDAAFAAVERVGGAIGQAALRAVKKAQPMATAKVAFKRRDVFVPVENSRYILFLHALAFGHRLYDATHQPLGFWRRSMLSLRHLLFYPLPNEDLPWIESEVSFVRVGEAGFLGVPGELFPELAVGGFDGSKRFGKPLISPDNPNPPDLENAPDGPYLKERIPARHKFLVGLANDMLGYIMPEYDFKIAASRSMLPQPAGHHYEETNSVGRQVTPLVLGAARAVLEEGKP